MLIKIQLPELGPGKTRVASDVTASDSTTTVENNSDFSANDYVIFEKPGDEEAEIVLLTSTTNETTIGHTTGPVFDHPARTPITEIKYNQAKIYRATSQTGEYSLVTTKDLTPDEEYTEYDDSAGSSTSWYKVKYYNETTEAISSFSSAVQGTGYTSQSLRKMADEVLGDFGDQYADEITRDMVRDKLNAGLRRVVVEIIKHYPDYFLAYTTQSLTSGTATYDLPTRFLSFQRVDVNYSGTDHDNSYKASFEDESAGYPDDNYQKTDPRVFFRGDTFGLRPTPDNSSGQAWLWYWQRPAELDDDDDEHGLPYGARNLLIKYALTELWRSKNGQKADRYFTSFENDLSYYLDFVAQARQTGTAPRVEVKFGAGMYEDGLKR